MRTFLRTLLFLAVVPIVSPFALSQEVEATVSVNTDRLAVNIREEVSTFGEELERYVNETRWMGDEWKGTPVKMSFNVAFSSGNEDGSYRASLIVISQRDIHKSGGASPTIRILDDSWNFKYSRGQPFQQDPVGYDQLTGLIDFYVLVSLGLDLDTYGYLGGQRMYERAMNIARRAELATGADGWSTDDPAGGYSRYGLINELTTLRYQDVRKFWLDYHYNGLDHLEESRAQALDSLNAYVTQLVLLKNSLVESSTLLRVINDTKHQEFAELFRGYADPTIWEKLLFLDPTHQAVYEAARDGE